MDKSTPVTNNGAANAPGTPPAAVMEPNSAWEPVAAPERSGGVPGASQNGGNSAPVPAAPPAKRGPGRPRGYPKSGGRAKGTPNRSTVQTRERIQELADPIAFLSDVMAGKRMVAAGEAGDMKKTWCYPTLAQRVQASETLLRKLLPDLKATELTGKDGKPLIEPTHVDELYSTMEVGRRIAFVLAGGLEAKRELDGMDAHGIDTEPEMTPEPEPEPEPPSAPPEPTEPPLPAHAYIFIEEGARERSGTRAWLAMESQGKILNTFHGPAARQLARDWVGTKFGASPAEEIEIPLLEGETNIVTSKTGRVGRQ